MLVTTIKSTDVDLTTTGALKARLGTTSTSDDATLSAYIRAASRWAETYVGYPLSVASYRETVAAYGTRNIRLNKTPIRGVRSIFDSTDTGGTAAELTTTEFRIESQEAGFLSRDDGWAWTVPADFDLEFRAVPGQEFKPWMVDYVAGYSYGGIDPGSPNWSTEQPGSSTDTGRTLPEDIEEAVIMRALSIQSQAQAGGADIAFERLGDLQVNYGSGGVDKAGNPSLEPYELLLDPYRRVV